ncbi:galactoside alpha-(1,2)-fucosyltransferase 1-like [Tubulanus polymorphus]|uniref:galactoside alpha-(1,2)-fucosyltransferase 1-like n=1 Tax=Tubulanus polymorphus TaxID=672921 RepID=UPI003DA5A1D1
MILFVIVGGIFLHAPITKQLRTRAKPTSAKKVEIVCVTLKSIVVNTSMTVITRERLGNNMFQYAALVGVALARGHVPINLNEGNDLRKIFNISAAKYPDSELGVRVTNNSNRYNENCCLFDPKLMKTVKIAGNFVLSGFFQNWRYFHPHASNQLRREFTFRKPVADAAESFLANATTKLRQKLATTKNNTKVTYVGVHVRRGDITSVGYKKLGMRQPTMDYFKKAMAIMESLYDNVFYVICSDDLKWCRKNFGSMPNKAFCPGTDRLVDLAILSKSNHSILTIGSFGFWAAFLANGTTTYFGSARALGTDADRMFSYDQYFMPEWIKIP